MQRSACILYNTFMSDWSATPAWLKSKDMLRDTDSQIHSNYQWLYSPLIQRPAHIHHCLPLTLSVSLSQFLSLALSGLWVIHRERRGWVRNDPVPCHPSINPTSLHKRDGWKQRKEEKGRESQSAKQKETRRVWVSSNHLPKLQSTSRTLISTRVNGQNDQTEMINTSTGSIFL